MEIEQSITKHMEQSIQNVIAHNLCYQQIHIPLSSSHQMLLGFYVLDRK
jgi:hypothetical protein